MKTKMIFLLPFLAFFFLSCEKEENSPVQEIRLSAIILPHSASLQEPQEISVRITTPTPCYSIETLKSVSGNTFEYNFLLTEEDGACIQVVKEHELSVVFDPQNPGTYTLNFLIDGELKETREIVVTED